MLVIDRQYIDGAWRVAGSKDGVDAVNPTTEEIMGSVPAGTASEIDRAARAAVRRL